MELFGRLAQWQSASLIKTRSKVRSLRRPQMPIFTYLLNRFFYRFLGFFRRWYLDGSRAYGRFAFSFLEKQEKKLALKITLEHFFEPLYQDRSFIGYILGFFFRSGRLIFGGAAFLILSITAAFFYFVWLAIPIYVIFQILNNLTIL